MNQFTVKKIFLLFAVMTFPTNCSRGTSKEFAADPGQLKQNMLEANSQVVPNPEAISHAEFPLSHVINIISAELEQSSIWLLRDRVNIGGILDWVIIGLDNPRIPLIGVDVVLAALARPAPGRYAEESVESQEFTLFLSSSSKSQVNTCVRNSNSYWQELFFNNKLATSVTLPLIEICFIEENTDVASLNQELHSRGLDVDYLVINKFTDGPILFRLKGTTASAAFQYPPICAKIRQDSEFLKSIRRYVGC